MRQNVRSADGAALAAAAIQEANIEMTDLIAISTPIAFRRDLTEAQADETERLERIRSEAIDPEYSLIEIARSKVSAQFLNIGEAVSRANRETMLRVRYDAQDVDVVIAGQEGVPYGFLITTENSRLYILNVNVNDHKILLATRPDENAIDVYVFDIDQGQYAFALTIPDSVMANAA